MICKDLINCSGPLADLPINDITNDSRSVAEGCAFFCISGSASDGHKYAADAAAKGASVIVAEHDLGLPNQVIVPDTHEAYSSACAAFFGNPADRLKLIGVTGTNGKTTVTYLLKSILEQLGHKVGLIGTIQNMIGDRIIEARNTTPDAKELHGLFRQMVDAGCDYAVMEVSSHALDQKRVWGLHFAAAIFTNLTQDHLDYHGTMDNYLHAKQLLFKMCDLAVINADDGYADRITDGADCRTVTCSAQSNYADYIAKGAVFRADGVNFELVGKDTIARVKAHTPGEFSVYNNMLAAVCVIELGNSISDVCTALSGTSGVKGRAEVVPTGRDFTVIIDYAHTPDGLENILHTMRGIKSGRLVVLFGCGGDRDSKKRPIMAQVAARLADYVIVTSDNPRTENPSRIIDDILVGMADTTTPYTVIENRAEAIKFAINNARRDDIIVLAGKGHETYQILNTGKIHFDEREVVRDALAESAK